MVFLMFHLSHSPSSPLRPLSKRMIAFPCSIYSLKLAHQVSTWAMCILSLSLRKDRAAQLVEGIHRPATTLGTDQAPVVEGIHLKTKLYICYTCAEVLGIAGILFVVCGSVSVHPLWLRLVDFVGLPVEFLYPPRLSILPSTFLWDSHDLSNIWLEASASATVSCWLGPLRGQLC